jgi:predicted alpha/beta-fold hydrolase
VATVLQNTESATDRKKVLIRTCQNVNSDPKIRKSFMFRKCPASGIDYTVHYVDSLPAAKVIAPTVLTVHGAPGSYNDFDPLLHQLADRGFRVIAPNFPGMLVIADIIIEMMAKNLPQTRIPVYK